MYLACFVKGYQTINFKNQLTSTQQIYITLIKEK